MFTSYATQKVFKDLHNNHIFLFLSIQIPFFSGVKTDLSSTIGDVNIRLLLSVGASDAIHFAPYLLYKQLSSITDLSLKHDVCI